MNHSAFLVIADIFFKADLPYYEDLFESHFCVHCKENISYNVKQSIEIDSDQRSRKLLQSITSSQKLQTVMSKFLGNRKTIVQMKNKERVYMVYVLKVKG